MSQYGRNDFSDGIYELFIPMSNVIYLFVCIVKSSFSDIIPWIYQ